MPITARAVAVCLFCLSTPAPAVAARWLEVGVATNGVKAYVDTQSLSSGKDWVQVRQRFVYPKPRAQAVALVDQQVVYRCSSRSVTTLKSVELDAAGRIRRRDDAKSVGPYKIAPGTLPQYVFDLVC